MATGMRVSLVPMWGALLDLIYPRCCAVCGKHPGTDGVHLCWDCRSEFEWVTAPMCDCCGDPIEGVSEHAFVCSWCTRHGPHFDLARSAVRFRGGMRELLHGFKYRSMTWLRPEFCRLLRAAYDVHYSQLKIDAVTSVPLYSRRERERTYNQSQLLASGFAATLGVPYVGSCLCRSRDTRTQTTLRANQRRENVRGAFAVLRPEWIDGRRLLLVDDVMTTGATVDECSRILKTAGAAAVYVLSVARG